MDVLKVNLDCDDDSDIPKGEEWIKSRYSLINSGFSIPARIAHSADSLKKYLGS